MVGNRLGLRGLRLHHGMTTRITEGSMSIIDISMAIHPEMPTYKDKEDKRLENRPEWVMHLNDSLLTS